MGSFRHGVGSSWSTLVARRPQDHDLPRHPDVGPIADHRQQALPDIWTASVANPCAEVFVLQEGSGSFQAGGPLRMTCLHLNDRKVTHWSTEAEDRARAHEKRGPDLSVRASSLVAGAGFEPATSGL